MNTELKNAVKATDSKAQYDTSAKRLLGQKSILAHILVKTVDEFKGMNPKDVVDCIEGTPHISTVPVEPGLTNAASEKNGERLVGFNTENVIPLMRYGNSANSKSAAQFGFFCARYH